MSLRTLTLAGAVALALAAPSYNAAGQTSEGMSEDYLIGYWGFGSPEECIDSDTLGFYVTGVFAVTNGGGNPVEALGLWKLEGDTMSLAFAELDDPHNMETIEAAISGRQSNQFTLTHPTLPDGVETLYRCDY